MEAPTGRCNSALDDLLKDLETTVENDGAEYSNSASKFVPRPPSIEKSTTVVNPKAKFVSMRTSQGHETMRKSSQNSASPDLDNILDLIGQTSPDKTFSAADEAVGLTKAAAAKSYNSVAGNIEVPKSHQSVDDFLSDLDAALMPSPRGSAVSALNSAHLDNTSFEKSMISSGRPAGSSLQQRMFPATISPPENSSVDASRLDLSATNQKQSSELSVLSSFGAGTSKGQDRPAAGQLQGQDAVVAGKVSKCGRVTLAGAAVTRGYKSSAFSKCACDNLRCIQCNFKVMSFIGCKWGAGVDYMFFRNANTNIDKLDEKLVRPSGPADDVGNFCAYCCQCSWTNVKDERALAPASGVGTDHLHWVCAGHKT